MAESYVLTNARLAPVEHEAGYSMPGAIVVDSGMIAFAGPDDETPQQYQGAPRRSLGGRVVTPGLIDCHTHLVYHGSRAREFEMRLTGATYEEIMRAGGGIFSTVEATRAASNEALLSGALSRVDRMIGEGVTTIEIKSGYGLDVETELRMLRTARAIETHRPVRIRTTFLGAHAFPKQMSADEYLTQICLPALDAAADEGLVDAVDGFCENIAFSAAQIERVFEHAAKRGLPVKLHAEQLSDQGGAKLAARFQGLSADHLEFLSDEGVSAMAEAGTVAVLLPGAFYMLKETRKPPVERLRAAGVPMALATDCNPGSSPMTSILLAMNMGATLFGLSPQECLEGVTSNAAKALGLPDAGQIKAGMRADLAIWDVDDPAELTYRIGDAPLHERIFGGVAC
ncbi:imidazolonepropionase [Pontixanthobacter aquaemixtae]|uniref:Imidazolonepropionase n=1 Tax=Pontixanthobacter aquaemixtae TaxID=1958940 RepID=A0A844ZUS0_9SPHN|nr:imidazolonepropionase [Pontixanthobacter aquaemixtae]MXO90880.1 imidazolonepropionase [Pontixanthobacter aquaemixtae]